MRKIVTSNQELCVGCNRCMRECPIEMANLTYLDDTGNIKVKVNHDECIACGACLSVCRHNAREYEDDLDIFLDDLARGEPISLMTAPSMRTNFPEWKRLLTYLRRLGVRKVFDVSLGADLCIWAHLRYIALEKPKALITQPCPAIVSYCEIHCPELLSFLSPVQSPMGCAAAYMRKYAGVQGRIAALSPCIAKRQEFDETDTIQYNITFARLAKYLGDREIKLPAEETGFDHYESGLGAVFPVPGGLKENIEFFLGKSVRIERSEGQRVYRDLDTYLTTPKELLPDIFDVLNCEDGCNNGSGCFREQSIFQIQSSVNDIRKASTAGRDRRFYEALLRQYDETLRLPDFLREYKPRQVHVPVVSQEDIQRAFAQLGKDTYAKQNFNCGACGSSSCQEMARKIALGLNMPLNCIVKSRDDMQEEHRKNEEMYRQNARYVSLFHDIGDNFSSMGDTEHATIVTDSMQNLCAVLSADAISLWKCVGQGGQALARRLSAWPGDGAGDVAVLESACFPGWFDALAAGSPLCVAGQDLLVSGRVPPLHPGAASVLAVPLLVKQHLWGFLALACAQPRHFKDDAISVAVTSGLLIASNLIEKELTDSLIAAREEALAGTRAKSDFLSRMSHEIRTPMNAIIGMTKIAGTTDDIAKIRHCLATIGSSSEHLLRLINDVLDMSKIEAGRLELEHEPFNLEQVLIKVCNIILDKTEEKGQKLSTVMGRGMGTDYVGDALRFSQVIANLLSNAVKFTPEGGRITLVAEEAARRGDISILRVSVTDTGIGMTEEQIAHLFSAFSQADNTIARRFGGTGLGLAISKSIIEKMNGRIGVESRPGEGSTFWFEVEVERRTHQESRYLIHSIRPSDVRMLIADGDESTRAYFKSMTDEFGIRADLAANGDDVLALIRESYAAARPYDMVFLDYDIPGAQCVDLIREMRHYIDKNTVIIMTTFLEWSRVDKEVGAAGVNRFIPKPLFPSVVFDAVSSVLGGIIKEVDITPVRREAPDFTGMSVLLAEDIEINREIFVALLESTRIQIDTAENGRIAVEMFAKDPEKYDLIVMDVQMPEMDGYEATQAIRRMDAPRAQTIPIIAMTANAFKEDIARGQAAGMNAHLSKPIDEKALIDTIRQYTANTAGRRARSPLA